MTQLLATEPELPPSGATRWSPQRKAMVVNAVHSGAMSLDEACRRYLLYRRGIHRLGACDRGAWRGGVAGHPASAVPAPLAAQMADPPPSRMTRRPPE